MDFTDELLSAFADGKLPCDKREMVRQYLSTVPGALQRFLEFLCVRDGVDVAAPVEPRPVSPIRCFTSGFVQLSCDLFTPKLSSWHETLDDRISALWDEMEMDEELRKKR